MKESARVLGPGCGPTRADIMFIGEAPGRLGADGSHLPFHGDKSGHNFESLLAQVGLSRYDIFVTNAALCNPRDDRGNNATPSEVELRNCSSYLTEQLSIVDPKIVVTLGATALRAVDVLEPHGLSLRDAVRTANSWLGRILIPLYHPGQRAMIHRSFANQLSDYQFVVETLKRSGRKQRRTSSGSPRPGAAKTGAVVKRILQKRRRVTYFALHKLLFLSEVRHFEKTGERLTSAYVIRQKDGPYYVELHVSKLTSMIPDVRTRGFGVDLIIELSAQGDLLQPNQESDGPHQRLSEAELGTIDAVVDRYGDLSNADLKRVSYLTAQMRALLRRERSAGENLFNAPLFPP